MRIISDIVETDAPVVYADGIGMVVSVSDVNFMVTYWRWVPNFEGRMIRERVMTLIRPKNSTMEIRDWLRAVDTPAVTAVKLDS